MAKRYNKKMYIVIGVIIGLISLVAVIDFLWLKFYGDPVEAPTIQREMQFGDTGEQLSYVMMGDSTSIAQGGDYSKGIAVETAQFLAKNNKQVSLYNTGVSGARSKDIEQNQLQDALDAKPDLVMIVVGSNDATHLTSNSEVKESIQATIDALIQQNCNVKIILTGSAGMGVVPRLPQPVRFIVGLKVNSLNNTFQEIVQDNSLTFAPIAKETSPIFKRDRSLFAKDNFHPNTEGYQVWIPTLTNAINASLESQPSHCS